jgi:hypothetical protein
LPAKTKKSKTAEDGETKAPKSGEKSATNLIDEKAIPTLEQKKESTIKFETDKDQRKVSYETPMVKKNFSKIAKRSRAWLQAMNE